MPPPPPKGPPRAPNGGAPMISSSALAVIKQKAARISRADVEQNDDSFREDDEDRDRKKKQLSSSPLAINLDDDDLKDRNYSRRKDDDDDRYSDRRYDDEKQQDGDGDGYGDGYGKHRDEYDDRYRDDDVVYDESDGRRHITDNDINGDDDYLREIHDEDNRKVSASTSDTAQPKKPVVRPGGISTDPNRYETPYEFIPPSRLPTMPLVPEIFNFRPILKATYRELRNFVLSPVEPGMIVRCYIERNRNGSNMMSPMYSFCADLEDGTGRELMVCKKVFYSFQSHHIFSLKGEDLYRKREQRSRLYLGKLRGNNDGTCFTLYDNGNIASDDNSSVDAKDSAGDSKDSAGDSKSGYISGSGEDPDYHPMTYMPGVVDVEEAKDALIKASTSKTGTLNKDDSASLYRKELCCISYNTKTRPAPKGVRGAEIAIPATFLNANTQAYNKETSHILSEVKGPGGLSLSKGAGAGLPTNTVPPISSSSLTLPFNRARSAGQQNVKQTKHCFIMHERTSKYDPISACLVDFKGRANVASTKNCQFIESSPQQDNTDSTIVEHDKNFILQMGKTTDDCFNIDVKYPLSLLQAFGMCISRFDSKLGW
jgi:hypothetical protein